MVGRVHWVLRWMEECWIDERTGDELVKDGWIDEWVDEVDELGL